MDTSDESGRDKAALPNGNSDNSVKTKLKRGVRQGDSFDTGLSGENSSRFNLIKNDILSGKCNPSIRPVMKNYKAKYEYARDVLAELARQGLLIRNEQTGTYKLLV